MLHIPYWLEPYSFLCIPRSLTLHLAHLWNTSLLGKKLTLNNRKIEILKNFLCILKTKRMNPTIKKKSTNILLKAWDSCSQYLGELSFLQLLRIC